MRIKEGQDRTQGYTERRGFFCQGPQEEIMGRQNSRGTDKITFGNEGNTPPTEGRRGRKGEGHS